MNTTPSPPGPQAPTIGSDGQPYGQMVARDRFADARSLVKRDQPVLVDGGAHIGRVTDRYLQEYNQPTVHMFEPIPPLAQMLQQKYAALPNVHIHPAAIGPETCTIEFNVVGNVMSSSVLKPSEFAGNLHGEAMEVKQTAPLPQVRLDEAITTPIDVLKLDLQGYELQALKGAEGLLDRTHIIITEVEFIAMYDGQPLFGDVDTYLRSKGFALHNLYDLWTLQNGQLTSGDALYVNTSFNT